MHTLHFAKTCTFLWRPSWYFTNSKFTKLCVFRIKSWKQVPFLKSLVWPDRGSNPQPPGHKADALPLGHCAGNRSKNIPLYPHLTGVRASISKPIPFIYLAFKKTDPFIYLIIQNVDLFIYWPLIFCTHFLLITQISQSIHIIPRG